MNEKHIVDLHDPVEAQDAATKNYVDKALNSVNPHEFATKNYVDAALNSVNPQDFATKNYVDTALSSVNANPLKKCYIGYIPNLEADISQTGFVVNASSISAEGYRAYGAFNNLNRVGSNGSWVANGSLSLTALLTIKCPEPVIIWRIAITALQTLSSWCLSASNDGSLHIDLLRLNERLVNLDAVTKSLALPPSSTAAYQYYKIDVTGVRRSEVGISFMQLYLYDTYILYNK